MLDKLLKMKADYDAQLAEMARSCSETMGADISGLLAQMPEKYVFVRWRQFTPYFNDGDACTFGVRDPYVGVQTEDGIKELDKWELSYWPDYANVEIDKVAVTALLDHVAQYLSIEDLMERTFGDHVEVTIYRDGRVESEETSHD